MLDRRHFLGALGAAPLAATPGLRLRDDVLDRLATDRRRPAALAGDEDFWAEVARSFTVDRSMVNLNNGGVSPAPAHVQEQHKRHLDFSNNIPPYHMWRVLQPNVEGVRQRLARRFGADPEEVAITRNASESLMVCQFGIDLEAGDEVLTTDQDYPRMINTFRQRERREGIVMKQISLPVPCEDDDLVVERFAAALTPRTRMILVSHMINLTGQILPVARVCALGRERGIPVIVDGAHALAHFDFRLDEIGCDYYATSLHKWLFAPIGTGLLFVSRDRIGDLWPLMAAPADEREDIRKFEQIGTHPVAQMLAIGEALTFHQALGGARKEARLVHLRELWMERLGGHDRVRLHTSRAPGFACGIGTMGIEGVDPKALTSWLLKEHRIVVTPIVHDQFAGIRVSPSVYTTAGEIDRFCAAVEHVLEHGLPA